MQIVILNKNTNKEERVKINSNIKQNFNSQG